MSAVDPRREPPQPSPPEDEAPHAEARTEHPQQGHHSEGKGFLQAIFGAVAMFWTALILFIVGIVVIIIAFNVW